MRGRTTSISECFWPSRSIRAFRCACVFAAIGRSYWMSGWPRWRSSPASGGSGVKRGSRASIAPSSLLAACDLAGLYVWHCHIVEREDDR